MRYPPTLGRLDELATGRDNNFNLLRMLAATGVIVSHAWPISFGPGTVEPLEHPLGDDSYGTCIHAFPIQQLAAFWGVTVPFLDIAVALPLTLLCAVLSWHLIEYPALGLTARRRGAAPSRTRGRA